MDNLENFLVYGGISKVYPMMVIDGNKLIQRCDEKKLNAIARNMITDETGNNER